MEIPRKIKLFHTGDKILDKMSISIIGVSDNQHFAIYPQILKGKKDLHKMDCLVPISLGELVDKYTILEIKEKKITDSEKLALIRQEKELLEPHIQTFHHKHYQRFLMEINERIWELSDETRESPTLEKCVELFKHNDRRFRVKNKINQSSLLKEQKSYSSKKVLFCGHTETGDTLINIGIVRYLSTLYGEVIVPVKDVNLQMAKTLYEDDPSIKPISINEVLNGNYFQYFDFEHNRKLAEQIKLSGMDVISVFYLGVQPPIPFQNSHFYDQFYIDAGIDPKLRFIYTHIPRNLQIEEEVRKNFVGDKKYIFQHNRIGDPRRTLKSDYYIFNVNECGGSNTPLLHFCKMIEDAEEVYMDNSSFFCLAMYLDLSRVKRLVVYARMCRNDSSGLCDMAEYAHPSQKWEVVYP
jgi:hypothetical protein